MYHQLLLKYDFFPAMCKFQQYQTTRYNYFYNWTWLNINQLHDNDQQLKHSISTWFNATHSINNIQFSFNAHSNSILYK